MGHNERSAKEEQGLCRGQWLSWLGVFPKDFHCEREEFSLDATDAVFVCCELLSV